MGGFGATSWLLINLVLEQIICKLGCFFMKLRQLKDFEPLVISSMKKLINDDNELLIKIWLAR